jgi:hypothetical protein
MMSAGTPAEVLDPELWERVSVAIAAVNAVIDEHLTAGKWVPSRSVPTMSAFSDSGWPKIDIPILGSNETPDYSRLFGLTAGELTPFSYSDVPELTDVIDYVTGRTDLVERLDWVQESAQVPDEPKMWLVKLQAANLVLSVIDRARALGRPHDPETLLTAYRERECSILAPELDADLIAPLVLTNLELDEPIELGDGVRLEKLDEATQLARARDHYSIEAVPPAVSGAATHAVVITGVKIDNSSWVSRMWRGRVPTIPFEKLDLVIECLRVVTHTSTGYAQVFLRPIGWADRWRHVLPPVVDVGVFRRYPAFFDNYGWLKKGSLVNADQLASLPKVFKSASKADKATRLALRRLSLADLRDDEDDKLVDACIGIEALLSDDSIEVTHKIATRGAAALATRAAEPVDAQIAFSMFKAVYGRRSFLVHGDTGKKSKVIFELNDAKIPTARLATILLQRLLLSRLTSDPAWTIKDLDDELLLSLNRGRNRQPANAPETAPADTERTSAPQPGT